MNRLLPLIVLLIFSQQLFPQEETLSSYKQLESKLNRKIQKLNGEYQEISGDLKLLNDSLDKIQQQIFILETEEKYADCPQIAIAVIDDKCTMRNTIGDDGEIIANLNVGDTVILTEYFDYGVGGYWEAVNDTLIGYISYFRVTNNSETKKLEEYSENPLNIDQHQHKLDSLLKIRDEYLEQEKKKRQEEYEKRMIDVRAKELREEEIFKREQAKLDSIQNAHNG